MDTVEQQRFGLEEMARDEGDRLGHATMVVTQVDDGRVRVRDLAHASTDGLLSDIFWATSAKT